LRSVSGAPFQRQQLAHVLLPEVSARCDPLTVLLKRHRYKKPQHEIIIRENVHHVGSTLGLLVQPFKRVRRVNLPMVLFRKRHALKNVLSAFAEHPSNFGQSSFHSGCDLLELSFGSLLVRSSDCCPYTGCKRLHHLPDSPIHMGKHVARGMHRAPLPRYPKQRLINSLREPFVGVAYHKPHPTGSPGYRFLRNSLHNGSLSQGPMANPKISRSPVILTASAITRASFTTWCLDLTLRYVASNHTYGYTPSSGLLRKSLTSSSSYLAILEASHLSMPSKPNALTRSSTLRVLTP